MNLTSYTDPAAFLADAQDYLEQHEPATALIFGNTLRMIKTPEPTTPYLAALDSPSGIELVAFRTPPHRLVVWSHQPDCAEAIKLLAHNLHASGAAVPGVTGPPHLSKAWIDEWAALTGAAYHPERRTRIYQLTSVVPPPATPGSLRLATLAELELVTKWVWEFEQEALGEGTLEGAQIIAQTRLAQSSLYLWQDDQPVSMVAWSRPTNRGITINLVYTPPQFRRRGYAMASVATLSQQLLDSGKSYCTLFTDLSNPTSNSIYQKVGYRPISDFQEYAVAE